MQQPDAIQSLMFKLGGEWPQAVQEKAKEILRKMNVKFKPGTFGKTESCRPAAALVLACRECGHAHSVDDAAKHSGAKKRALLDDMLRSVSETLKLGLLKVSFEQLGIRLAAEHAVNPAKNLFESYKSVYVSRSQQARYGSVDFDRPAYTAAVFFIAAQRAKVKVDRKRLIDAAGVGEAEFRNICKSVEECCNISGTCNAPKSTSSEGVADHRAASAGTSMMSEDGEFRVPAVASEGTALPPARTSLVSAPSRLRGHARQPQGHITITATRTPLPSIETSSPTPSPASSTRTSHRSAPSALSSAPSSVTAPTCLSKQSAAAPSRVAEGEVQAWLQGLEKSSGAATKGPGDGLSSLLNGQSAPARGPRNVQEQRRPLKRLKSEADRQKYDDWKRAALTAIRQRRRRSSAGQATKAAASSTAQCPPASPAAGPLGNCRTDGVALAPEVQP